MSNADRCVCCGEIIPEGTMACPNCLVVSKKQDKRLIDANALMDYFRNEMHESEVIEAVKDAPTVDAVEVVRCKDCSHAIINEKHPNRPLICCLTKMCGTTNPNWFCADGERKDNDNTV